MADGDTKERLLEAGERLFAEVGIHRVRIRELNELAGQRNSSALHYHFGSRDGLVAAILGRHQARIDDELGGRLDELVAAGEVTLRALVEAVVRPLCAELETRSGRDFLRIVPQVVPAMTEGLRSGEPRPITPQTSRLLGLLERSMPDLAPALRRERLVVHALVLTSTLADRAQQLEAGHAVALDADQFAAHVADVLTGALTAPSSVP